MLAVLLGTTALAIGADLVLKAPCVKPGAWADNFQYKRLCYNDLQALYYARGLSDDRVPYIEEPNEYPALTGTEMYITALLARSEVSFFWWNALVLGACALLTTAALWAAGKTWRVLLFAASPALVLYATHNWDLMAVAGVAGGFSLWGRKRLAGSGALFGLATAAKLFPAAALFTGVVALLAARKRRETAIFAAGFAVAWAAFNVPYMVARFSGWFQTWTFHAKRGPDFGTPWYWIGRRYGDPTSEGLRHLVDRGGLVVMAVVALVVLWLQVRRGLPMVPATGVLVAAFLVVSKVHSPQYALWLLPFFVLVPRSLPYWAVYAVVDLALFVSGFRWIADPRFNGGYGSSGWQKVFTVSVFARAIVLIAAGVHFALQREVGRLEVAIRR